MRIILETWRHSATEPHINLCIMKDMFRVNISFYKYHPCSPWYYTKSVVVVIAPQISDNHAKLLQYRLRRVFTYRSWHLTEKKVFTFPQIKSGRKGWNSASQHAMNIVINGFRYCKIRLTQSTTQRLCTIYKYALWCLFCISIIFIHILHGNVTYNIVPLLVNEPRKYR